MSAKQTVFTKACETQLNDNNLEAEGPSAAVLFQNRTAAVFYVSFV
jgi:hypothetical protein